MRAWRGVLIWALVGTLTATVMCLTDLHANADTLGFLVTSDPVRPEGQLLVRELPDEAIRPGGRHDGAFFYALARDPFHLDEAAPFLDRPRYRSQRILYPMLAWALHPTGGGPGLVWAMFAVGVAAIFLGGVATGRLSLTLGGPPWPAAMFGVLPGAMTALRISVADALALALTLLAVWLSLRRRHGWAVLVAVLAVLSKESMLITLVGFALWRRDRRGVALAAVPAAVAAAWWLYLRAILPTELSIDELRPPLVGWWQALRFWADGTEPLGLAAAVTGLLLAGLGIAVTRPRHPLWWATVLNLAAMALYSPSVLAPERNATRMFMVLQLLGILLIVTRRTTVTRETDAATSPPAVPLVPAANH